MRRKRRYKRRRAFMVGSDGSKIRGVGEAAKGPTLGATWQAWDGFHIHFLKRFERLRGGSRSSAARF